MCNRLKNDQKKSVNELMLKCSVLQEKNVKHESEKLEMERNHSKYVFDLENEIKSSQLQNKTLKDDLGSVNKALVEYEDKVLQMKRSWGTDQSTVCFTNNWNNSQLYNNNNNSNNNNNNNNKIYKSPVIIININYLDIK